MDPKDVKTPFPAFQPGKFKPVIEILGTEQFPEFYDEDLDELFVLPTPVGKDEVYTYTLGQDTCGMHTFPEQDVPDVPPMWALELDSSFGTTLTNLAELTACPCFMQHHRILDYNFEDPGANLYHGLPHACGDCTICTHMRSTGYGQKLTIYPCLYPKEASLSYLRKATILPMHPHFPGRVLVGNLAQKNPWIDKHDSIDASLMHLAQHAHPHRHKWSVPVTLKRADSGIGLSNDNRVFDGSFPAGNDVESEAFSC